MRTNVLSVGSVRRLMRVAGRDRVSVDASDRRWIERELPRSLWRRALALRSIDYPLQYILGTQPFGNLTIRCRPGVLIPRPETEEWTLRLAEFLLRQGRPQSILDLCSGTGCIALSLARAVSGPVYAVDISAKALKLARANLNYMDPRPSNVQFLQRNVLTGSFCDLSADLVVTNPPYISRGSADRSVARYEPSLALYGHFEFYSAVFRIARAVKARALVSEIGSKSQSEHLIQLATKAGWRGYELNDFSGHVRVAVVFEPGHALEDLRPCPHGTTTKVKYWHC